MARSTKLNPWDIVKAVGGIALIAVVSLLPSDPNAQK